MKRKRFSAEQIVAVVKQAEMGVPVAELIRQVGISEQPVYRWKKQYVGLEQREEETIMRRQVRNLSMHAEGMAIEDDTGPR